jgi:hypothetical protein
MSFSSQSLPALIDKLRAIAASDPEIRWLWFDSAYVAELAQSVISPLKESGFTVQPLID